MAGRTGRTQQAAEWGGGRRITCFISFSLESFKTLTLWYYFWCVLSNRFSNLTELGWQIIILLQICRTSVRELGGETGTRCAHTYTLPFSNGRKSLLEIVKNLMRQTLTLSCNWRLFLSSFSFRKVMNDSYVSLICSTGFLTGASNCFWCCNHFKIIPL